jgi:phosphoglycerol transferase MdoB-like AlkP superfamily enzyme
LIPDNNSSPKPSWLKDILNGFLAWLIAFLLYMLPALVVGISMGFDLGPKLNDTAEVSRRISQAISEMYQSSWYLHIGFIVVLAVLVFWRAWAKTRHTTEKSILHGATIGTVAAILVILQMLPSGAGMGAAIPAVVCIVAGLVGGRKQELQHAPH